MADPSVDGGHHPSENSFFFTRFMVFWIAPLIKLARERQLQESDVWDTPTKSNVLHSHNEFRKFWIEEQKSSIVKGKKPSLFKALLRCYFKPFALSGLLQLLFVMFQVGQPFLVGALVHYVRTGDGGIGVGMGLAVGLGALSVCSSISLTIVFYISRNIGTEVKAAIMMAIYEKTLSITSSAKQENSVGQTTNLAAIDAEKLFLASQFPHFLWQAPLTCLIVMGILIGEIGYGPALAGMALLALIVPLQNRIAGTIGTIRRSMIKFTDKRVMLINEILQAIRIIKLYAWEAPMEKRVQKSREEELSDLSKYHDTNASLREMLFVVQPLAVLVIYMTSLYGFNKPLNQVQVIKVISFLTITRFPMNLLGVSLKYLKDGTVSLQRIERYLLLPALTSNQRQLTGLVDEPGIVINNAVLSWGEARSPPSEEDLTPAGAVTATGAINGYTKVDTSIKSAIEMTDIKAETSTTDDNNIERLKVKFAFSMKIQRFRTKSPNELVAIVGAVGSGKSSFISTLLGEMPIRDSVNSVQTGGESSVQVHGPISYCAQTPWIQNMSLRNNVLFGQDADRDAATHEAYEQALSAACLVPDLKILPDGDETESKTYFVVGFTSCFPTS
jgi:ABC-type multidrug transport system fused ATPase/permease subunit